MSVSGRIRQGLRAIPAMAAAALLALAPARANAGAQVEEKLAASVVAGLQRAIADNPVPANYATSSGHKSWLDEMAKRLSPKVSDGATRDEPSEIEGHPCTPAEFTEQIH